MRSGRGLLAGGVFGSFLLMAMVGPVAAAGPVTKPARTSWMAQTLATQAHQSVAAVEALKAKDGTWSRVAAALKVSPATVRADVAQEHHLRTVAAETTAALAALAHKPASQVRAMEAKGLTAQQVAAQLHLAWPAVQTRLASLEQARATAKIRDRAITDFLAKITGKKPAAIAALKAKKGVTWLDVAHTLGLH